MSMSVPHGEVLKISQEVTHAQASARRFARVRRTDSFFGCSDAVIKKKNMWKVAECVAIHISSAHLVHHWQSHTSFLLELVFRFPATHRPPGGNRTLWRKRHQLMPQKERFENENRLIIATVSTGGGGRQATFKPQGWIDCDKIREWF